MIKERAAPALVAKRVPLDRAVRAPATVDRFAADMAHRVVVEAIVDLDGEAPAADGAERRAAGALDDRQCDAAGVVIGGVHLHDGPLVGTGSEAAVEGRDGLRFHGTLLVEVDEPREVGARGEQQRAGWCAVPAAAAGLLVVRLNGGWERPVADQPHVGLVDAHAERVRRNDHVDLAAHEGVLHSGTFVARQTGVVVRRLQPVAAEQLGDLLAVAPRAAVDDRGPELWVGQRPEQQRALCRPWCPCPRRRRVERQVGPVEPGSDHHRLTQAEPPHDLGGDSLLAVAVAAMTGGRPRRSIAAGRRR